MSLLALFVEKALMAFKTIVCQRLSSLYLTFRYVFSASDVRLPSWHLSLNASYKGTWNSSGQKLELIFFPVSLPQSSSSQLMNPGVILYITFPSFSTSGPKSPPLKEFSRSSYLPQFLLPPPSVLTWLTSEDSWLDSCFHSLPGKASLQWSSTDLLWWCRFPAPAGWCPYRVLQARCDLALAFLFSPLVTTLSLSDLTPHQVSFSSQYLADFLHDFCIHFFCLKCFSHLHFNSCKSQLVCHSQVCCSWPLN